MVRVNYDSINWSLLVGPRANSPRPFVFWSLLRVGIGVVRLLVVSLLVSTNSEHCPCEAWKNVIAHCCLLWAIESWLFILQSVDLAEMIIKYFIFDFFAHKTTAVRYSTRERDFLLTIPSAFTSRLRLRLRLPSAKSNQSWNLKRYFLPSVSYTHLTLPTKLEV